MVKDQATYTYRHVPARLKIDGSQINRKRVYKAIREKDWQPFRQGQKPLDTRKHEGTVTVTESYKLWFSGGLNLSCDKGKRVRVAFALDCGDRKIISWVASARGIDAGLVLTLLIQAVVKRFGLNGKPPKTIQWLTDNGSCYKAAEKKLCRGTWLKACDDTSHKPSEQ